MSLDTTTTAVTVPISSCGTDQQLVVSSKVSISLEVWMYVCVCMSCLPIYSGR